MREVRCCCDPSRLFGWLPESGTKGRIVNFAARSGEIVAFEVDTFHTISHPQGSLAYKSHDYPLELLKQIPEFEEATEYEIEAGKTQPLNRRAGCPLSNGGAATRRATDRYLPSSTGVLGRTDSNRTDSGTPVRSGELAAGGVRK